MKKFLIILASLFGLVILAAFLLPIIFKDDIQAAIDKELDNNLNAKIYYNTDEFSLSLFHSFPNLSVTVGDFGIVGNEPFESDTLVAVDEFSLTLDIMSVIKGEQIKILDVSLNEPVIHVIVLEDGMANYDIVKSTADEEEETEEDTTSSAVNLQIQSWEITNASVIYDDRSSPMLVGIAGLNHSGLGNFADEVFDMKTATSVESLIFSYDGIKYISDKPFKADITMAMDLANMKFTFKENELSLSNFGFGFDGYISMPAEDIEMDLTFGGHNIDLLSILSLIPGVYQEYMNGVTASGKVSFDGSVKGVYNETTMPKLAMSFGIADGKVAYAEYPIPMEDIQINASFDYPSADLRETSFLMDKFHMTLDGEELSAYLLFKDLEDYYWEFRMNGGVDLEKLTKVVQVEGMTLKGLIQADLDTKGKMSDLDAGRYADLPTSGSLNVSNFQYEGADLPQGFGIVSTKMTFDPQKVVLENFKGNAGKTDLQLNGKVTNYLQYALADSAMLYGELTFNSSIVDLNEWMTDTEETTEPEDTSALEVVRVPQNIDFVLASAIDVIKYDDMDLKDFEGKVIVRSGAVKLEKVGFDLMDGHFVMDGSYESAPEVPVYDFDFAIQNMSIASAYKSFVTVQKMAPLAEKMTGKFSADFKLGGTLGSDMMPVYDDMQGAGLVKITEAALNDVKVLAAISNVSKLSNSDGDVSIKDVKLSMEIKDGRIYTEPFDVAIGGRKATVGGSSGVDGSLDYVMSMDVPSGQVGEAINSLVSSYVKVDNVVGKDITLNLGIQGTYDDPQVKLLSAKQGTGGSSDVASALKDKAKETVAQKKEEVTQQVQAKAEEVKAEVKVKAEEVKTEVTTEVKEKTEEVKTEAKDKATNAVKGVIKKKSGGK